VHLLSGIVGLAMAGTAAKARLFAIGYGAVYVLVTILGFIVGDGGLLLSLIPINTADNLLHLAIAVTGIGIGLASPPAPAGARSRSTDPARGRGAFLPGRAPCRKEGPP